MASYWLSDEQTTAVAANIKPAQNSTYKKDAAHGEVWVMDSDTQQVNKVTVSLNANGAVESGLDKNDYVVIAGVERLVEGQVVKAWIREEGI